MSKQTVLLGWPVECKRALRASQNAEGNRRSPSWKSCMFGFNQSAPAHCAVDSTFIALPAYKPGYWGSGDILVLLFSPCVIYT